MTEFPVGTRIAVPLPWEHSPSGCVEWVLVGWTTEDDDGLRLPILDSGWEDEKPIAWGSDFAIQDPRTGEWHFFDGERCDDENLMPMFTRRQNRH